MRKCFISEAESHNMISEYQRQMINATSGSSPLLTIINPYLIQDQSISLILNTEVTTSNIVQPETERLQPVEGSVLCMYNIVKDVVIYDEELYNEILSDIENECIKYGEIINKGIEHMPIRSEYAVVKVFYRTPQQAKAAQLYLSGRRFAGRIVLTSIENK